MPRPKVTVIVPMYNVESYVGECLQSLKAQSYTDFEALCIDDGSTDETLAVARKTVGGDPRFTIIQQENSGLSATRNTALELARGCYVLNLDSDDYYKQETLLKLVNKADRENLDVLYFTARTFYETRDLRRTNPEFQDNRSDIPGIMSGQEMYVEFERTGAFRPSACLFMFRKDLVDSVGLRFVEGIVHEDLLFTVLVTAYARRCAFLNEVLYLRRMRRGSIMTLKRGTRNIRGLLTVSMKMEEWLRANRESLSEDYCDAFCHRLYDTWELMMEDIRAIGEAEASEFRDGLTMEERIALNLHGIEPVDYRNRILNSTTFRVGRAIMAVPTGLKDRMANRG